MQLKVLLPVFSLSILLDLLTLLESVDFYINGVQLSQGLWPKWEMWDDEMYTLRTRIRNNDQVALRILYYGLTIIENFVPYTTYKISINSQPWFPLFPGVVTNISSLHTGFNQISINSTDFQGGSFGYSFSLWVDSPSQALTEYSFRTENGDFMSCTQLQDIDFTCTPEINATDLQIVVKTDAGNEIVGRHVSMLSRYETWKVLNSGGNATFQGFFATRGENYLEILVRNQTNPAAQRLYRFQMTRTALPYQVRNVTLGVSDLVSFASWKNYFTFKPRPHPEVMIYVSATKIPSPLVGFLRIDLETWQPSAYTATLNNYSKFVATPFNSNFSLRPGLNLLTFSPFDSPATNLSFAFFQMNSVVNATGLRIYWNPLVDNRDGRDYHSNCSFVPLGYSYAYPADKLNSLALVRAAKPNLTLVANISASTLQAGWKIVIPAIPFQPNSGLLFLLDSVYDEPAVYLNFYGQHRDNLYLTSNKSFYPIYPGVNNSLSVRTTPEDISTNLAWNTLIYIMNNDTSVGELKVGAPAWKGETGVIEIGRWDDAFNVTIRANDSNAEVRIEDGKYIGGRNGREVTGNVTLPRGLFTEDLALEFVIYAESRNIYAGHKYWIRRVDVCGDGARWNGTEECDTGSGQSVGSGCWQCKVESGWKCSGGSEDSADVCVSVPTDPPISNDPPTNNGTDTGPPANDPPPTNNGTDPESSGPEADPPTTPLPNNTQTDPPPPINSTVPISPDMTTVPYSLSYSNTTSSPWFLPYLDVSFLLVSTMSTVSFLTSASLHSFLLSSSLHSPSTTIISLITQLQLLAVWGENASPPDMLYTTLSDFKWTLFGAYDRDLPGLGNNRRLFEGGNKGDVLYQSSLIWILLLALMTLHLLFYTLNRLLKRRITAALVHFMTFTAYIYWYFLVYTGLAVIWIQYTLERDESGVGMAVYAWVTVLVIGGPVGLVGFLYWNRRKMEEEGFNRRFGALYECIRLRSSKPSSFSPALEVEYLSQPSKHAFHTLKRPTPVSKDDDLSEDLEMNRSYHIQPTSPESLPKPVFYSIPIDKHKTRDLGDNSPMVNGFSESEKVTVNASICVYPAIGLIQALGIVVLLCSERLIEACVFGAGSSVGWLVYLLVCRPVEGRRYAVLSCCRAALMGLGWVCLILLKREGERALEVFGVALVVLIVMVYEGVFILEQLTLLRTLFKRKRVSVTPLTSTELPPLPLHKCVPMQPDVTSTDRQTNVRTELGLTDRPDISSV